MIPGRKILSKHQPVVIVTLLRQTLQTSTNVGRAWEEQGGAECRKMCMAWRMIIVIDDDIIWN